MLNISFLHKRSGLVIVAPSKLCMSGVVKEPQHAILWRILVVVHLT